MSILNLVKNASIKQQVLKEHPVQGLSIEEKTTYLNGIALMANVDGEIADSEKEYIKTLTNSFKLDKSAFDDCIDFAMNPDGETVELLIQQLQGNDYSYTFLLDSLMLINSDKKQDEDENKLFHQYAEMLNISALNLSYLTQLFYSIKDNEFGDFYAYSMVHDANHDGLNLDIHYYKYLLIHYGYDDIEWTMQASIDLKEMKEWVQESKQLMKQASQDAEEAMAAMNRLDGTNTDSFADTESYRLYAKNHLWVDINNDIATIGLTNNATSLLGWIGHIEFSTSGKNVIIEEDAIINGESEFELFHYDSPLTGEILQSNQEVEESPDIIDNSPENTWLIKIRLSKMDEVKKLMNIDEYLDFIE